MKISKHAINRAQQRGITNEIIDIITRFGTPKWKPNGALQYSVSKKEKNVIIMQLKRLINVFEKSGSKSVILSVDDEHVITVYHRKN